MHKLALSTFAMITAFSVAGLVACGGDDETSAGGAGGTGLTGGSGGTGQTGGSGGSGLTGTGGGNTGGTGGGSQCSLVDAGDDCNTLTNTATPVTQTDSTDPLPTGTGGEIVNGIYHTTAITAYAGSAALGAGIVLEQTWEICDGEGHLVGFDDDDSTTYHKNFTLEPSGTDPGAATTCSTQVPNTEIDYSSYTATSDSLTLYSSEVGISVTLTLE